MFTHSFIHSTGIILGIGLIDREAAEEISLIPLLTESMVVSAVTDICPRVVMSTRMRPIPTWRQRVGKLNHSQVLKVVPSAMNTGFSLHRYTQLYPGTLPLPPYSPWKTACKSPIHFSMRHSFSTHPALLVMGPLNFKLCNALLYN